MRTRGSSKRMRATRSMLLGAALALVVVMTACQGGGGSETAGGSTEVAEGHELFQRTCGACHGLNAEGMPRLGKNLNGNEFVAGRSDAELVEFLKVGRPASHPDNTRGIDMPPKGGNPALTDQDLGLIVGYMRSIQ